MSFALEIKITKLELNNTIISQVMIYTKIKMKLIKSCDVLTCYENDIKFSLYLNNTYTI